MQRKPSFYHSHSPRVAVVGAGLTGLATAYYLARSGRCQVALFERKRNLGGRTCAFEVKPSAADRDGAGALPAQPPIWLDNSIHIAMGCCTALMQFLKDIGAGGAVEFYSEIPFVSAGGRRDTLRLNSVLNKLHPLGQMQGILGARFLTGGERLAVVGLFSSLARMNGGQQNHYRGRPFAEYVRHLMLPAAVVKKFLEPLLIGALNTPYEQCDFGLARTFFATGLLRNPQSGWMGVFRGDLQSTMIEPATAALRDAGVTIHPVHSLEAARVHRSGRGTATFRPGTRMMRAGRVELNFAGGQSWRGEAAVVTIPWFEPAVGSLSPAAGGLAPSPILCLHLVYDRPVLDVPCLGLLESPLHWLFRRDLTAAEGGGQLISAVVSCSTAQAGVDNKELIAAADAEIRARVPGAKGAMLRFARAFKNHPATFLSSPGCGRLRPAPGPVAGQPGLYLAGEWTDTGWPSTMEGAVRSAIMALRHAVPDLGLNLDTLPAIAELPRAGLMKLLLQP